MTRSNGQGTNKHYYRNRFNFFDSTQTRQFLLDGPLHIAPGTVEPAAWPFAVDVPLTPSPRALRSDGGAQKTCYLSLSPEDVASTPLPASFAAEGRHRNVRFEAYVEYHLEATLMTSGAHGKDVTAVFPIQMSAPPLRHAITNFDIHRRSMQNSVSTYHLVPGMETAELTFKQKTKQLMGSSKVPMFGYTMHVDCPAVIQLGNPAPIPFLIRIVPDPKRTSEVIHDVDQTVVLTSLELVLKAHTATVAPSTFSSQHAHDTFKHSISLPVAALGQRLNPLVTREAPPVDSKSDAQQPPASAQQKVCGLILPSKWQAGDEAALNIGAAMDFRLSSTHATALGQPIARTAGGVITPGFESYCVRHNHTLKWKISVEIAGKTVKHESEQTVTIVGPSESHPPPPLAAVAREDEKAFEQLPAYGASTQQGGPSNYSGVTDAPAEELPSYTK